MPVSGKREEFAVERSTTQKNTPRQRMRPIQMRGLAAASRRALRSLAVGIPDFRDQSVEIRIRFEIFERCAVFGDAFATAWMARDFQYPG